MAISIQPYGFIPSVFRTTSSLGHSLWNKILSISHQMIGNKDNQREYELMSEFYFERASAIVAYYLFGDDLLSPVVNMEKASSLVRPLNLKKIDDCFNEAATKKPAFTFLERSKYPNEKITRGICAAFALKFISKCLHAIRSGQDVCTAVCALGQKFEKGGSERTAIVHGLQYTISTLSPLGNFQTMANLFNVNLSTAPLNILFGDWENAEKHLATHLEALEDGVYYVDEINTDSNSKSSGHLVAYIKAQNNRFLFDPQLGTVRIPQHKDADYLIKSLKNASCRQITFYKASLLS